VDLFGDGPPAGSLAYQRIQTAPYQSHSETSREAAEQIGYDLNKLQARVLAYLRSCPLGATDEEMQVGLAMNPSTQRPRRIELMDRRLIVDSGRKRKTRSGRWAVVWTVADAFF
jgi:hypothetical protein